MSGYAMDNETTAVGACVVFHNICELFGDYCLAEYQCNMVAAPDKLHQPYVMLLRII